MCYRKNNLSETILHSNRFNVLINNSNASNIKKMQGTNMQRKMITNGIGNLFKVHWRGRKGGGG